MKTKIVTCDCSHDYQDQRYGTKKRVANYSPKRGGPKGGYVCTVCGKVHSN